MEINCNDLADDFEKDYEVCIIGSGAAGMTLASELSQSGKAICVVESGGFGFDMDTQNLYDFENTGIPRKPHVATRLRMYGGTTNHWDGRCGAFDPIDFEEREWVPYSGWPITRDELEPYYVKAANYCDLKTYPFEQSILQGKMIPVPDLNPEVHQYHLYQFSEPTRFGQKYRYIFSEKYTTDLIYNANATNLVPSDNGSSISYLQVKSLMGRKGSIRAKEYILCAGGIENARILLYSNTVIPEGIGNQNDLVGRFFMEHPRAKLPIVEMGRKDTISHTFNEYRWKEGRYLVGMKTTSAYQKKYKTLNSAYWFLPQYQSDSPLNRLRNAYKSKKGMIERIKEAFGVLPELDDIYLHYRRSLLSPGAGETAMALTLVTETEQAPNPNSRIRLSDQTDVLGLPKTKINWQLDELDRHNAEKVMTVAAVELAKKFNVRVRLPGWLTDSEGGWQNGFVDVSHHLGTTRMSVSDKTGVVDKNCKVYSTDNLYVAGGSVFPTSSLINPTLTIVALAVKLAEHIKQQV